MRAHIFLLDPELNNTSLAVCICCALMFNDSKFVTESVRQWNALRPGSSTRATHLVTATGHLSHGDPHFYHRNTQSWAQFAVKQQDFFAMSPEMRSNVDWGDDGDRLNELVKHNDKGSTELDPGLLTVYGHIIGSKQGHNNQPKKSNLALSYLFRALALQPDNVVVNLSIATTYLAMSTRDDTENKQYTMAQGQAFLYRYYSLRIASKSAVHLQEAEFNLGRAWHMVGRTCLAVPAYEKALSLSEAVQQEARADGRVKGGVEDFAQEAALALRSIYIAVGNQDAARAITEEWLVL
jgi:general transcription factor 3C polypeptide 3 (transcription factor C subunit 4)